MKNTMTRLSALLCALLLCLTAVFVTGCADKTPEEPTGTTESTTVDGSATEASIPQETTDDTKPAGEGDAVEIGEGAVALVFKVVHRDGTVKTYNVHTDKQMLGEALLALNLIEGEVGDYGLYVKTVDGETCDYDTDGYYWALYIGDAYAQTGVDSTEIVAGTTYSFKAEK